MRPIELALTILAFQANTGQQNYLVPNIEVWIAILGLFLTLSIALVGVWVKIKSEVAVLKSEYATLRSMVEKQISVDEKLLEGLSEVKAGIAAISGELKSKQDK